MPSVVDNHSQRFIRFCITGGVATFVHVCVYVLMVEVFAMDEVRACVPAFCVATIVGYSINRTWTFRSEGSHTEMLPRYFVVAITGLLLNVVITYVVVDRLLYWYGIALIIAIVTVPLFTFSLNHLWTFRAARQTR